MYRSIVMCPVNDTMKPKLTSNLILRIDDSLKNRLSGIQEQTGYSISEVVRQCLNSFADYYEENKCIVLPLSVVPQKELEVLKQGKKKN